MKKTRINKVITVLAAILCFAVLIFATTALAGCGARADTIIVSGSSSVTPIMEKLAAEYEKTHDVRITVNMSSSGAGISDTQNGLNDFGMSSRELKDSEKGITGETLCMDGIALIVNKECNIDNVTTDSVKALFENGSAIPDTGITAAIGRDASSGTRSAFDELLEIGEYHNSVATLAETGNVIEVIKSSKNSLGYISYGSLTDSVKAVSLDGVVCSYETIVSGEYKLQRPFVLVTREGAELSETARGFYDYIMSDAAQKIITKNGYISVKQ